MNVLRKERQEIQFGLNLRTMEGSIFIDELSTLIFLLSAFEPKIFVDAADYSNISFEIKVSDKKINNG